LRLRRLTISCALWMVCVLLGLLPGSGHGAGESAAGGSARTAASAAVVPPTALQATLDRALRAKSLRDTRVSALVVRMRDGAVLFERSPDRALIPASNMKILTAMAALDLFGPSHQFETVVRAERAPDAQGAIDQLVVEGSGDPVLNSEDWWRLAADLRRKGLRHVRGDLRVDDSAFDAEFGHPDWGKLSSRAYHAPVGALTANYGAYFVSVTPGARADDPVRVEVDPPIAYLEVSNRATTGGAHARQSLSVARGTPSAKGERVLVSGVVRAGDDADVFPRSVSDPGLYAGAVFKMQLEANGIRVDGEVVRGACSACGHELLRFKGRPLSQVVQLFMKYSNNAIAESLLKAIGARSSGGQGSWQSGLAAIRQRLVDLGLPAEGIHMVDGSGLSPRNRLSPRVLVEALMLASGSFDMGPELMAALPIAARDGTLEKRAGGSADRARAKTGLLSDQRVTALSGFARMANDDQIAFSILVNGYRGGSRDAMRAVDGWLEALVHGSTAETAALGSSPR